MERRDLALEVKILTKRGYFTVSDSHQLFPGTDALFGIEMSELLDYLRLSKIFRELRDACVQPSEHGQLHRLCHQTACQGEPSNCLSQCSAL